MTEALGTFEPSCTVCSSCDDVLSAPLGKYVLLRNSYSSLQRSAITCHLCRLIQLSLVGGATATSPSPRCKLMNQLLLLDIDSQPHIWAQRRCLELEMIGRLILGDHSAKSCLDVIMMTGIPDISQPDFFGTNIITADWGFETIPKMNEATSGSHCLYDVKIAQCAPVTRDANSFDMAYERNG